MTPDITEIFHCNNDLFFVPNSHVKFLKVHGIEDKTFLLLNDVKLVFILGLNYNECYPPASKIFCGGKIIDIDSIFLIDCKKCT